MALKCKLFVDDANLEAAAVHNQSHIHRGARGSHVGKIQKALARLDDAVIDRAEVQANLFDASTERAVLHFKQKRNIVNRTYQDRPDAIVGIMTMSAMDHEMVEFESNVQELAAPFLLVGQDNFLRHQFRR